MTTRWSLGVLIGVPILALVIVLLLAFAAAALIWLRDDGGAWLATGSVAVAALITAVFLFVPHVGYWPLKAEYHQWRPVSGTVQLVNSRIISDGNKSVNQRFVIQLAGDGRQYGCDDTRCSLLKPGDHVTLSCKREWQYAGVSGYGCDFVRDEAA